ncbi:uncharacterized protein YndB with AHSA1/START domain [Hamadaea flava]|uniref:SRPBCC family protein n=1 Tax=Hamadaea flava TaxID=1742688 RepID=A0ABV8LKG6_9ACTN|nr:SRPBCC family protein [Hamadaea flava]MCP2325550.1 uncharacterized protein YndB with AHSA1/START domain [Hamadaea flava]
MMDIIAELAAVQRETGRRALPNGDARTVRLRRAYNAKIDDVWDALTRAERIVRWFLPVSGDLRLGGRYQFEGNAGGEVLECEAPERLRVTWFFGEPAAGDVSEVEVRLTEDGDRTMLDLEHVATVDPERWATYGPGAVGVGWELGLLGLSWELTGVEASFEERMAWGASAEGRELTTGSSEAWGQALLASGATPEEAATATRNTTEFYVPPENAE